MLEQLFARGLSVPGPRAITDLQGLHAATAAARAARPIPIARPTGASRRPIIVAPFGPVGGVPVLRRARVRDLADALVADVAELMAAPTSVEGRPALEVLDEWHHDERPPME